ncbi:MAG: hypothetical protein ACQKBV_10175, partial [Puniceicoccales bacterium]
MPKRGFALVVALSLMGFILLLILSLSTLTQVESMRSQSLESQSNARANALFGLQVAIGELQRLAGPDQRVTGTSTLKDPDADTMEFEGNEQSHWTGVWDADGNLLSWLVSGNEGLSASDPGFVDIDLDLSQSPHSETVEILPGWSVEAPLCRISNTGSYAFWVSDEGVKAKVSLGGVSSSMPFVSAQKVDISQMTGMEWLPQTPTALTKRKNLLSIAQLKMDAAPGEVSSIEALEHDLTANSLGLLTNTAEGGLKQDLTLALFSNSAMPTGQMFDPLDGGASSPQDPGGPLWAQLQSWSETEFNDQGELPVRPTKDDQAGFYPVVTQAQFYVIPRYGPAPERRIYLDVMPSVTLWNPYDRPLEMTDYRVDYGRSSPVYKNYHDGVIGYWDFYIDRDGNDAFHTNPGDGGDENNDGDENYKLINVNKGEQGRMPGFSFTISNLRLEPGQAIVFSPPSGNQAIDVFRSADDEHSRAEKGQNELTPGFRPTASYQIDTGHQLVDAEPFVPPFYKIHALRSSSQSLLLSKLTDAEPEVLTEHYNMGGKNVSNAGMHMLSTSDTLGYPDLNGSVGFKMLRNFVDENADPSVQWLAQHNPRGATQGPNPLFYHTQSIADVKNSQILNPGFETNFWGDGLEFFTGIPASSEEAGVGFDTNPVGPKFAVLYESPPGRDRLRSIGQLMHAPLYFSGANETDGDGEQSNDNENAWYRLEWSRFDNFIPAYAVGNSLADSRIPLDSLKRDWSDFPPVHSSVATPHTHEGRHYDYSYLLNKTLWDGYFFSTLQGANQRTTANE